ncbi:MAG: hypothetical protein AAF654_08375 [Myxococcota bacterium]
MSEAIARLRAQPSMENALAAISEIRADVKITKAEAGDFRSAAAAIENTGLGPKVALEFIGRVARSYPEDSSLSWIGSGPEAFVPVGSEHEPNYDRLLKASVRNLMEGDRLQAWVERNPEARGTFVWRDPSDGRYELRTFDEPVKTAVESVMLAIKADPKLTDAPGYSPLDAAYQAFRASTTR